MKKQSKYKNRNKAFFPVLIWTMVLIWCALFLILLGWGVLQSFKTQTNFWMDSFGFPNSKYGGWQLENYILVFKFMREITPSGRWVYFPEMLFNTLYFCFVYGFASLIGPIICSYVYAKYSKRVPWVKIVWILFLIQMYVPLSASLAASLNLAVTLGYYDNLWLFVIVFMSGFDGNFLIYFAIWKGLSWEYAEAAQMDGAKPWTIFLNIMFPMTKTIFLVLFITQIISKWANYETPMIYLRSYPTVALGVFNFQQSYEAGAASSIPVKIASLIVVAIPLFVLFMVFREKMMGTLTMGGLKG